MLEIASLIAGIIGALFVIPSALHFIYSKLKCPHKIDINYKNIIFAEMQKKRAPAKDKPLGLIIYDLKIVNRATSPLTIKSVDLLCIVDGEKQEIESRITSTGTLKSGESAIILTDTRSNIVLVGWKNMRSKLVQNKAIAPGEVLSGSLLFPVISHSFGTPKIDSLKLSITDYAGNRSSHEIRVQPESLKALQAGFKILDIPFTQNTSGEFVFCEE